MDSFKKNLINLRNIYYLSNNNTQIDIVDQNDKEKINLSIHAQCKDKNYR
jgi:hypothetical protein